MTRRISNKRLPPFSIRFTERERAELEKRAELAGLSLGGYCKFSLMGHPPSRKSRRPRADTKELARLLGELGCVGNNLNQIARAVNMESIIDVPLLDEALNDISALRASVMVALGYRESKADTSRDIPHDH